MSDKTPQQTFEELTRGLPRFGDGRIDYTHAQKAPVLNAIVYFEGKILILKRSQKVLTYKGLWNGIAGFIDELKPIEEVVRQELSEEIALDHTLVTKLKVAYPFTEDDPAVSRTWVIYAALVVVAQKPAIVLDWEHTDYAWIKPEDLKNYTYVKGFNKIVATALSLL